ncbi:MAG: hypothetical protein ACQUHE_07535, partial [Bacteroidia bacterium]
DRNFQFYIQPTLDQNGIQHVRCFDWEANAVLNPFFKNNHQIHFEGYKILLLDPSFDRIEIGDTPTFNSVWLHQNPKSSIINLRRSVIFQSIIMDATNYTSKLTTYVSEANKIQIQPHVLKKNKAYLIDLNN